MIDSMKTNVGKGEYPVAYHGSTFINGTVCDITGQPRVAKVKVNQQLVSCLLHMFTDSITIAT